MSFTRQQTGSFNVDQTVLVCLSFEDNHMMRFKAFPEILLNLGMREIGDCQ